MKRTYAAEELFGQRKYKEAQELSEAILKSCKPNYNIVILMGRSQQVYKKDLEKALEYFTKATEMGPDYFLGHMNSSAMLLELERFDDAIEASKKAIKVSKNENQRLKSTYNLALSIFKQGLQLGEDEEMMGNSYPHFEKASKLPAAKASSHFYLGFINERVRKNNKEALKNYKLACDAGHSNSCKFREDFQKRSQKEATVSNATGESLLARLRACYKTKFNMTNEVIDPIINDMKTATAQLDEKMKKESILSSVEALKCP